MDVSRISESRCLFTETHLWLYPDHNDWLVGMSDYAQDQHSDVTYIELPVIGQLFLKGDPNAVLETVKTAETLTMPITGVVTRVNTRLYEAPLLVNQSPYEDGWLYAVKPSNEREFRSLMCFADYDAWLDQ